MVKHLISLLSVSCLFALLGCALEDQKDDNETVEGRFLKLSDGQSMLVNDQGLMIMDNEHDEGEVCEAVKAGDKIAVTASAINQSDPASATVTSCTLIEEGGLNDLPNETLDRLQEMGWTVDKSD